MRQVSKQMRPKGYRENCFDYLIKNLGVSQVYGIVGVLMSSCLHVCVSSLSTDCGRVFVLDCAENGPRSVCFLLSNG